MSTRGVAEVIRGDPETSSENHRPRVDGLNGNLAGQHIDIRLTADDGYTAVRSYSGRHSRHGRTPGDQRSTNWPTGRSRPIWSET